MNSDIRLMTSFLTSRKRKKLRAILGDRSDSCLIDLWLASSISRPKGLLHDMTQEDIALDANWDGDPAVFVDALVKAGFLDINEAGEYSLHDWKEHQGWVFHSEERSERARMAAGVRWGTNKDDNNSEDNANRMQPACYAHATSNAPSPSPSPNPKPNPKPKKLLCDSDHFSSDFEEFWKAYPNFNRDKKGTFKAYQATLKGASRINKATPEQLLRAAKRYSEEVRDREKRYILHGTTFLGSSERWKEFDMPLKNLNGEILREDIDPEDFREGSCINYKKLEAAKRGYIPYMPGQGKAKATPEQEVRGN